MMRWAVAAIVALTMGANTARAVVIYHDDFDGAGGANLLHGTTPDIAPIGVTWMAGVALGDNGALRKTNDAVGYTALLPFTPEAGNLYTLRVELDDLGPLHTIGVGFTQAAAPTGDGLDTDWGLPDSPSGNGSSPVLWGTFHSVPPPNGGSTFIGPGSATPNLEPNSGGGTLEIQLDTRDSEWSVIWNYNGDEPERTHHFIPDAAFPNINYLGFTTDALDRVEVGSLTLTVVPEPTTLALVACGAMMVLRRRRARPEAGFSRG